MYLEQKSIYKTVLAPQYKFSFVPHTYDQKVPLEAFENQAF